MSKTWDFRRGLSGTIRNSSNINNIFNSSSDHHINSSCNSNNINNSTNINNNSNCGGPGQTMLNRR